MLGRFDQFFHTFTYFFNIQGLFTYGIAISLVKVVHEFSHAYVAKRYGLHVPTMGVAFIILWPVLYTDVTDGWKLSKRSQRLAISFAGIAAELVVGGFSLFGWAWTSPGLMQSVFFVLATSSLLATLLINLNPAVRFDGYYILCDLLGIDNLQYRAYNVFRWKYIKWLLGVDTPLPEEGLSPGTLNIMTIYAIYTYQYRIILYTGIAVFVYFEFTKSLGILLFLAEVIIFMLWPVIYESKQIYMLRKHIHYNRRILITSIILALFLGWFILPFPYEETYSAIIAPKQEQLLYVPSDSKVEKVYVERNQKVELGQPIVELQSKSLLKELGDAILQKEQLENEVTASSITASDSNYVAQKKAELAKANDLYQELLNKQKLLHMAALIPGSLYAWNEDLKPGQSVPRGTILGKISKLDEYYALTFVPENQIDSFKIGQKAKIIQTHPFMSLTGTVVRINPARAETLNYLNLASIYRGPLPVTIDESGKQFVLVESYYIVYVEIDPVNAKNLKIGQIVEVRVRGPWQSKMMQLIRYVRRVLLRESSL